MKNIFFLLVSALLVWFLAPIPLPGQDGVYNNITGTIWCKPGWCLYEIGHKLDDDAGWISHTPQFSEALQHYMALNFAYGDPTGIARKVMNTPGVLRWGGFGLDNMSEAYSTFFAAHGGNIDLMPPDMQRFYNRDEAQRLIEKYETRGKP